MDGQGAAKKMKLGLVAALSFLSLLFSYFPGYNLRFSTLIFSLFAHAIDRKYMFLVCNGILALLLNNFNLGFIKCAEKQTPAVLSVGDDAVSLECDIGPVAGEECQNQLEFTTEEDEDDEEEEVEDEVNDAASVSTEELNQKIEEFIRKMKEEIRVEAQHQLITALLQKSAPRRD